MSPIETAQQTLTEARTALVTVTAEQTKLVEGAQEAFATSASATTAAALDSAQRIAKMLIGAAQGKVDAEAAELASLERDLKLARMTELQEQFNSTEHHKYLESLVPEIVKHRRALADLATQVLADADERIAAFHEHEQLARELGIATSSMQANSVRDSIRGSLDTASRLALDAMRKGDTERFTTSGLNKNRAMISIDEVALRWSLGA